MSEQLRSLMKKMSFRSHDEAKRARERALRELDELVSQRAEMLSNEDYEQLILNELDQLIAAKRDALRFISVRSPDHSSSSSQVASGDEQSESGDTTIVVSSSIPTMTTPTVSTSTATVTSFPRPLSHSTAYNLLNATAVPINMTLQPGENIELHTLPDPVPRVEPQFQWLPLSTSTGTFTTQVKTTMAPRPRTVSPTSFTTQRTIRPIPQRMHFRPQQQVRNQLPQYVPQAFQLQPQRNMPTFRVVQEETPAPPRSPLLQRACYSPARPYSQMSEPCFERRPESFRPYRQPEETREQHYQTGVRDASLMLAETLQQTLAMNPENLVNAPKRFRIGNDVYQFVSDFEACCVSNRFRTDQQKKNMFFRFLHREIIRQYQIDDNELSMMSWEELKQDFFRHFATEDVRLTKRCDIFSLRQGPKESTQHYYSRALNAFAESDSCMDEPAKVCLIVKGLSDYMKQKVLTPWSTLPENLQDLYHTLTQVEAMIKIRNQFSDQPRRQEDKSDQHKQGNQPWKKGKNSTKNDSHKNQKYQGNQRRNDYISPEKYEYRRTNNLCFICEGDHFARDCPQKQMAQNLYQEEHANKAYNQNRKDNRKGKKNSYQTQPKVPYETQQAKKIAGKDEETVSSLMSDLQPTAPTWQLPPDKLAAFYQQFEQQNLNEARDH